MAAMDLSMKLDAVKNSSRAEGGVRPSPRRTSDDDTRKGALAATLRTTTLGHQGHEEARRVGGLVDGTLDGAREGIRQMEEWRVRYNWFTARCIYKINSAAASTTFQSIFMGLVGLVHALLFGILFALIFPDSPMLEDPGSASGDAEEGDTVLAADDHWNFLPSWGNIMKVPEGIWNCWLWMSDTGHQGNVTGLVERLFALYVTGFGILYFSCIIGLIVEEVMQRMEALRQGKTKVVEAGHVIMLGWTDKSLLLIQELILANESEGGGVVVVLAEDDKETLERQVYHHFQGDMRGTQVVIRNGSRLNTPDLNKMSLAQARSIIVLSDNDLAPNSADSEVMQVVLAMSGQDREGHIVAEVRDVDNEKLVKTMNGDSGPPIETVVSHDIIGRLMLMCVRFPGLAAAYGRLLGFDGSEFYVEQWPELEGLMFRELQSRFPDAVPIGVRSDDGTTKLNPPLNYTMKATDSLVVFAEDNDTYKPEPPLDGFSSNFDSLEEKNEIPAKPLEMMLFCGWRRDLRDMIKLLDSMVAKGSHLHILCTVPIRERNKQLEEGGLDMADIHNLTIVHMFGSPSVQRHLEQLSIELYTSCLLLSDADTSIMQSDSSVLATLVLVRSLQMKALLDLQDQEPDDEQRKLLVEQKRLDYMSSNIPVNMTKGVARLNAQKQNSTSDLEALEDSVETDLWEHAVLLSSMPIVCEILDPRTQQTIQGNEKFASISDFLQSNDMVSKILAMVGEDIRVKHILDELLQANRSQLEVVKPSDLLSIAQPLSFTDVSLRVRRHGITLVGFFDTNPESPSDAFVPFINPEDKITKMMWTDANLLVVITSAQREDEAEAHPDLLTSGVEDEDDARISETKINWENYGNLENAPIGELVSTCLEQKNATVAQINSRLEQLSETLSRSLTLNEHLYEQVELRANVA